MTARDATVGVFGFGLVARADMSDVFTKSQSKSDVGNVTSHQSLQCLSNQLVCYQLISGSLYFEIDYSKIIAINR